MFSPEQKIGNYALVKRLGRGGFGEVWLAERRTKFVTTKVAVKLPLDDQIDHKAIKQEAEIWERASGHPNVLPIIEADEYDGQVVIVSEFAPDGSLHDLLKKSGGSLPIRQTLELSIGILAGLEFLHSRTIIHRDLKPANVLLQGQTPRLADFGISRVMKAESASLNSAGTPVYMAPEAFDRKRNVQTDIWSVGVMMFEMLTGEYPFPNENVTDLMAAIVMKEPAALPPHIPPSLAKIISKALAKNPARRYKNATELKDDLSHLLYGTGADFELETTRTLSNSAVVATTVSSNDEGNKTIAILPFTNLTGDPATHFYEFSLADAVTTDLARLRSLIVRPSSLIAKYQGKDVDPCKAGKEMSVNSVLSAGFMFAGDRVRVTAQLLNVATTEIIWSDRIDCDASDVFALQDTIAQQIIAGLNLHLSTNEQALFEKRPTEINEAYEEYLRGRDRFARFIYRTISSADCDAAIESFKRAAEIDPNFALAWSGLGASYANKVFKGIGDGKDYDIARSAFERALELDPNIIEARVLMCLIRVKDGEKKTARAEIASLHQKYPNAREVYFVKGVLHRLDGDYENSLSSFDRFERLDPTASTVVSWNRARIYSCMGDNERAIKELDRGSAVEPDHPFLKFFRAQILFYHGAIDEGTTILRELLAANPHLEGIRPLLAMLLAAGGKSEEAYQSLTEKTLSAARADCDIAYWTASAYALLGEKESALEWLEHSIRIGFEDRTWMEKDKSLTILKDDPRFAAQMEGISNNR